MLLALHIVLRFICSMRMTTDTGSLALHLSCPTCTDQPNCKKQFDINDLNTYATCCNQPLVTDYDLSGNFDKEFVFEKDQSMWRYFKLLPVLDRKNVVSLGEGMTPILKLNRIGKKYGYTNLALKNEEMNPTGSFKSRGLSVAVSKAKELGVKEIVMPTAGNAGGALSAYCAAAGIKCTVIMPAISPKIFKDECRFYGANLILMDGLIDKCGQKAVEIQKETGAFNMSTLKEPYRLQGKRTMGFEIAEQYDWKLPDVIVYPTGGGTGLIAIWEAFQQMVTMGWLDGTKLPKMVAVQSSNCSPVIDYIEGRDSNPELYTESVAYGLAVPSAFGRDLISQTIQESKGYCITTDEKMILPATSELAEAEGIAVAPETGAIWEGLKNLTNDGVISKDDSILLLNTGNALKYLESFNGQVVPGLN